MTNQTVIGVQRRMMELGRIRMGDKKGKGGSQQKLTKFRLTSASQALLEAAAALYGGEVQPWDDAPDEGYFELYTNAAELDIILPPVYSAADGSPTLPYSQWFELWTAAGCQRRCDGITESLSGDPCMCNPEARECGIVTRLNVMLPRVPGIGTWLLQSKGWNAATILPGTLDVLLMAASQRRFIPAVLRLEQRTKKIPGEGTRKFVVPMIDVPDATMDDMLGEAPAEITTIHRPALIAAGPPPPAQPESTVQPPPDDFGPQPEIEGESAAPSLLTLDSEPPEGGSGSGESPAPAQEASSEEMATADDRRGIFEMATARGMDDARIKEILVEVSGQDSTQNLPRSQVQDVIDRIMKEE